ncbi:MULTISPECIES: trans-sulfuration enzyme family protein [Achromobacter]|jgi:methionine-gamma-lyase|uniref:trans-sulfuration enzyme family protein n=1 Tax=Achromobacter TaxID=222 RepID=UPI00064DA11B|nr:MULTISPECIES: aminotransferase class I/II-fold pyridoxal phosphate-dependent enzyme [Achromobacter]KAA5922383.1 aminotransferase class I/II-fold pyridoxal phosphate-dependent enzyme [Achromobacter xylosoxidans]KMJ88224.1 methionine gamma-lyase [Achromobacter xylosoxidans]MCH1985863.1 aminotransferase class I/II-fold pyridoxal phosphate-dependent enzyme [Achromobacter xylosoxidans]MCH4586676.1 aminotransferase class I/II-fold pyridoxal phosphate-dependent enzyme [Achromobacter xylosoxidans]O
MSPYSDSYTRLAQAAVSPPESSYPVAPPLYQTASFATDEASVFLDMATRPLHSGFYTRYGNPTTRAFESAVADLEGGECALATASGMGAITAALFAFAARGDHVVAQRVLYGGTTGLLQNIAPQLGIDVTFVDQADVAGFAAAVRPNTRLFMLESPSNPMLRLTDLARLAEIARARGITTLVDNTIASPINQRPLEFGIDLVMHSATKYLCGHGDVSAGVLVGDERRIKAVWEKAYLLGATLDPFAAWLVLRGLRTLPMRVARQNETALKVARHLEAHASVCAVHYPGLESHPQRALAQTQMSGHGGVLSFEVAGGMAQAERVVGALALAHRSASFGSFSTLVVHPAAMWAGMMTPEQLAASGLPPGLIRLGVGFESPAAIIDDLDTALAAAD